jgi:hypothetical protein
MYRPLLLAWTTVRCEWWSTNVCSRESALFQGSISVTNASAPSAYPYNSIESLSPSPNAYAPRCRAHRRTAIGITCFLTGRVLYLRADRGSKRQARASQRSFPWHNRPITAS